MSIVLISLLGFSQATNVGEFRIANATTAFGQNLPLGTKVYNIATGDYWVATAGVINTATLTTASGSFTQLNTGAADQDLSYDAGNHEVDITGGNSAIIPLAVDDGATEGLASFTTNDFNTTAGNVAIDYTNGQKATTDQPGFITDTDWDTFNDKVSNVSTQLSEGTRAATTYGITSDGGSDDLVLPAANTNEAGLMTDVQFDKLAAIASGAEVNLDMITEKFEEDDGTPTAHSLAQTAVTPQGCRVSVNGATLDPSLYTLTTTTITLDGPVLQYDVVVITYSY